jgi:6-phosphogluconolactonase/glucosamine-6-phosphate isomerase/deaminase
MNDKFLIHHFPGQTEAAAAAGESLNQSLMMYKKQPVLLMLSAGSAFKVLDYVSPGSLGKNLTISVLDERFTPSEKASNTNWYIDPLEVKKNSKNLRTQSGNKYGSLTGFSQNQQINNFLKLQQTQFYTDALKANCNFLGTVPKNGESKEELAKRWGDSLIKWRDEHPNGKIIATLGMGLDGHTAGIFPLPEDAEKFHQLFESEDWIAAYEVGNKHQYKERITTTLTFFKEINEGIVFVCGEDKREKFDAVISRQGKLNELPALGIYQIKTAQIFTDIK